MSKIKSQDEFIKRQKYLHLRTSLQIVGNGFQNMLCVYLAQAFGAV
ncbi:hypothetical protein [Bergeyella zoohelcum]|nr:hypothetical protein [Bergeyella zoohelcum]MDY6024918.1 hypothetical protein [Bergeyella zoohelcum]